MCEQRGIFFVSDVPDCLEGGESRNSRWVGGWGGGGGGSVSADADSLDVELAQECLPNDLQSDSGGGCWETDEEVSAGGREKRERKAAVEGERERESRLVLTMALACLGLGCTHVRSKGTVCKKKKKLSFLVYIRLTICMYEGTPDWCCFAMATWSTKHNSRDTLAWFYHWYLGCVYCLIGANNEKLRQLKFCYVSLKASWNNIEVKG